MNKGYNRYNHKGNGLTPRQKQQLFRKTGMVLSVIIFSVIIILSAQSVSIGSKASDNYHKYYTSIAVMPGDTLSDYYRTYGEHYDNSKDFYEEVCMINDISKDEIHAGMYIILPYYSKEIK